MTAAQARLVRADELDWEPMSPELVLVSPAGFAVRARERLPAVPDAQLGSRPRLPYPLPPPVFTRVRPSASLPIPESGRGESLRHRLWVTAVLIASGALLGFVIADRNRDPQRASFGAPTPVQPTQPRRAFRARIGTVTTSRPRSRSSAKPRRVSLGTVHLRPPSPALDGSRDTVLSWRPTPGATYYDVQVYRNRTKIFESWPAEPMVLIPGRWPFGDRMRTLDPGRYTWYVWPGFGDRAKNHYRKTVDRHILTVG